MSTCYHAKYFAAELSKRSPSGSLEKLAVSLSDAQVDLNPHQVEAALFAFNSPLSKGAILADEVGLGKTIEAGLVISQKWAEKKRKILIIAPSNLRKQWSQELQDKFFLPSIILEKKIFNAEIKKRNLNPFKQDAIVICSFQFVHSCAPYIQEVNWDLVVIDEAHRLRNVYKTNSRIATSVKVAVAHAPKILLTATPLQNSLLELFGLVSIIDDYVFGDIDSFKQQFGKRSAEEDQSDLRERLKPICLRTLRRQVLEYVKYTNRIAILEEFNPSQDEKRLYDLVSEYLQKEQLFALPNSQRKLMTLILRKLLASSTFAIAPTLVNLKLKLINLLKQANPSEDKIDELVGTDEEGVDELQDEWEDEEDSTRQELRELSKDQIQAINEEIKSLDNFIELANSITKNSKGESLLKALRKGFSETKLKGGSEKAIIFTESRRTQEYLFKILEATEYKDKILLFNGSNSDAKSKEIYQRWLENNRDTDKVSGSMTADKRAALVEYFRDEAVIMIATEAAAEGINLQFCSLVVNFDLPWNPQRIEQRIGRCHRYGQKSDVVVVNFLNRDNEADQRVYELLDLKFKLFTGVFGASDEVLGSIESGIDFEKRIAEIYQQCRTPIEIQESFDRLREELDEQITGQYSETKRKLLENFDEEVQEKLRLNLQNSREILSKYEQWLWNLTRFVLADYAEFSSDSLSFRLKKNPFEGVQISEGPYRAGKEIDDAHIYRLGRPLAQLVINKALLLNTPYAEVVFNYSNVKPEERKKISVVQELIGKSGILAVKKISISSFEEEDHLILSGVDESGKFLDEEQLKRLFSLKGSVSTTVKAYSKDVLAFDFLNKIKKLSTTLEDRNAEYFEIESDKLDKWAEDKRNSLKANLKELDESIKEKKKVARSAGNLQEKLKFERERKNLESQRDKVFREYDEASKEIEKKKDSLLDEVEKLVFASLKEEELLAIQWRVV